MKSSRLLRVLGIALIVAAGIGVVGFVVMSLWNWLVPAVFGGPPLHFWQAIGLLVLTRILTGRFGRGHGHWGRGRMHRAWRKMTPEERDRLRENLYRRCGARDVPQSEPKA